MFNTHYAGAERAVITLITVYTISTNNFYCCHVVMRPVDGTVDPREPLRHAPLAVTLSGYRQAGCRLCSTAPSCIFTPAKHFDYDAALLHYYFKLNFV